MRLRSLLFAPGDSARKAEKALASEADAVILDLEDSVAPSAKDAARAATAEIVAQASRPGVIVRVNPLGTPWYLADLAAAVRCHPAAVLLPKCTGPEMLRALHHHLEALEAASGQAPGAIGVLALVTETSASVQAMSYAGVASRLLALCFGSEDLSADLGIAPRGPDGAYPAPVAAARAATLIAAAAAGVPAIDTPFPDPRDPDGLAREAAQAATDGFAGKFCIHPAQIAAVNAAFSPSAEQVRWAASVRDAFAADPGAGVLTLDGKMIDRPHLRLAERILSAAG
jgi:citrate lyase subunit beta / citryl-CoA lyase